MRHALPTPGALPVARRPLLPAALARLASDERLVEQVRAGSETAFEVLYDRHHRGVLAFCRHMLGSTEEAEDAVQHTFMAAYRALLGSSREISLRAWLYTIARNRCLSMLRARRERPLDDALEPSTEHLSAEVQRREDLRALLRDVAELPEEQRAALVLAELGDVSHAEIAAVLGCPRDKVKALVFQARSSLAASRAARETPCAEIREQLASLHGGSLRRSHLRRHLRDCAGCRAFKAEVAAQRRSLALVLPVAPSLGLKRAVLGALFGGGSGGAAVGAGTAASGGGALAVKALVVLTATGGGVAGVRAIEHHAHTSPAVQERPAAAPASAGPHAHRTTPATGATPHGHAVATARHAAHPAQGRHPGATAKAHERQLAAGRASAPGHRASAPGQRRKAARSGSARAAAPGQVKKAAAAPASHAAQGVGRGSAPGRIKKAAPAAATKPPSRPERAADPSRGQANAAAGPAPGQAKPAANPSPAKTPAAQSSGQAEADPSPGQVKPPADPSRGNGQR